MRSFVLTLVPLLAVVALAACDDGDRTERLAALEGELEAARVELDATRANNENLAATVDALRQQIDEVRRGQSDLEGPIERVEAEFRSVWTNGTRNLALLAELEEAPGAEDVAQRETIGEVRQGMEEMLRSVQTAAQLIGVEVNPEAQGEPPPEPSAD